MANRLGLCLAALLVVASSAQAAATRPHPQLRYRNRGGKAPLPIQGRFRVFILAGQSNMVGQGQARELPDEYRKPHPRVLVWANGQWERLVPAARFGPEVGLGRALAEAWPNDTIGIVKVAIGGTSITAFLPDWSRELANKTGDGRKGPLYKHILTSVEAARKVATFELAGFLWKQGGKDARNRGNAENYLRYFRQIITALRKDTDAPALPAFIGTHCSAAKLREFTQSPDGQRVGKRYPLLPAIIRAHNDASAEIPHVRTVHHGRLPKTRDGIHFNTEGQLALGTLFADAICRYYAEATQQPHRP